jgi:hypothetical protein
LIDGAEGGVGLYKLNAVYPHHLKNTWSTPCT